MARQGGWVRPPGPRRGFHPLSARQLFHRGRPAAIRDGTASARAGLAVAVKPRIVAAASPGEIRVAVLRDDTLLDYAIWRPGAADGVGDLHRGRVIARVPAMAGSFLALNGAEGFLPDSEGGAGLREGDFVSVRVTRAAQGGKGPRLTARLGPGEVPPQVGPGAVLEFARYHSDALVEVDDGALAARLKPSLGDRVHVVAGAFDDGIEEQVQALEQSEVDLPGGARVHVPPTP